MLREVIGLIPAAGRARRVAPLPCSKELFPVGFDTAGGVARPRSACEYLLERMRVAGVRRAYIVLRDGKWDIPAYLADGHTVGIDLAYIMARHPHGVPYTLDQAYPFVRDAEIAFGLADIVIEPADAYRPLLRKLASEQPDAVLGVFPVRGPGRCDRIELDGAGRVRSVVVQPARSDLSLTWMTAVWRPSFTRFMHDYVDSDLKRRATPGAQVTSELRIGDVLHAAVAAGRRIETVAFDEGRYIDIGTPETLLAAVRRGVGTASDPLASQTAPV